MSYIPTIDESSCVAQGDCEELAPEAFRVEDTAIVIGTAPDEQLIQIAQACPTSAIGLIDAETGEQVYP